MSEDLIVGASRLETPPDVTPAIDISPDDVFPGETELDPDPTKPDVGSFRRAFRALAWYQRMLKTADEDEKKLLARIEEERLNVQEFYSRKRAAADSRIIHWKAQLHNMMTILGVKKYATPYGTSFYKLGRKKTWLKDGEDLVAWAKTTGHAVDLLRIREYPDKKSIETYVESTGVEDILQITEKEEVQVRLKEAG
jgi:hypothetical protein